MESLPNIKEEDIVTQILLVRGMKVMLDSDLAFLYGVSTSRLNEQVKRNIQKFPDDFMFQLTNLEWEVLISQDAISKLDGNAKKRGGRRKLPFVFTEHGAIMLASVLNSQRAITTSIQIVRVFVKFRSVLESHKDLAKRIEGLENKYDEQLGIVFKALRELMKESSVPRDSI